MPQVPAIAEGELSRDLRAGRILEALAQLEDWITLPKVEGGRFVQQALAESFG